MSFKFIDLFAGIGGFRTGLEALGGKCVLTCEKDKFARQTYEANFNCKNHAIHNDIMELQSNDIPKYDILCAGFPCQPFSIAGIGVARHYAKTTGFDVAGKGNLFFEVVRIINETKPKVFILENVKNLISHNGGQTFTTICAVLKHYLRYDIQYRVINAKHFVPQNRERVLIVGFREKTDFDISKLPLPSDVYKLCDYLENDCDVDESHTLSNETWEKYQLHKAKHLAKKNGFGYRFGDRNGILHTLTASYLSDRTKMLFEQSGQNPRILTTRECKRIMGFGDNFIMPVSKAQSYKQLGNAVVPQVVEFIGGKIIKYI